MWNSPPAADGATMVPLAAAMVLAAAALAEALRRAAMAAPGSILMGEAERPSPTSTSATSTNESMADPSPDSGRTTSS